MSYKSNAGQGGPKEIAEGRPPAKENVHQSIPAPDTVPDEWANKWLGGVRTRGICFGALIQGGNRVR